MGITDLTEKIKQYALGDAGFDLVGIAKPVLEPFHETALLAWVAGGHAAGMEYMKRAPERRAHPESALPSVRSVISLAVNYYHPEDPKPAGHAGKVARYAYGEDYHKVIEKKLRKLARFVIEAGGPGTEAKSYVDTGPLLEKAFARQAGLGFVGKNTNVITRDYGSWVFLAGLLTNLELHPDAVHTGSCGSCTLCLEACPTGALLGDYRLDAGKCLSYLTIESKEPIPESLKPQIGEWAFGCDICQEVCPYNFRQRTTRHEELYPQKKAGSWIDMEKIEIPAGSPLKRSKYLKTIRMTNSHKAQMTNEAF